VGIRHMVWAVVSDPPTHPFSECSKFKPAKARRAVLDFYSRISSLSRWLFPLSFVLFASARRGQPPAIFLSASRCKKLCKTKPLLASHHQLASRPPPLCQANPTHTLHHHTASCLVVALPYDAGGQAGAVRSKKLWAF